MKRALVVFGAALFMIQPIAAAEDGPSYDETVAFLQEKLNTHTKRTDGNLSGDLDVRFIESQKCIFEYRKYNNPRFYQPSFFIYRIPFSQLDPSKIRAVNATLGEEVYMETNKGVKVIRQIGIYAESDSHVFEKSSFNEIEKYAQSAKEKKILLRYPGAEKEYGRAIYGDSTEAFANFANLLSPSGDNAPRVAKALTHLVRLCGGKEELF